MVSIRPARPADAAALARMFERCSPRTRYERFHGVVCALPQFRYGDAVVAVLPDGEVVGLASAAAVPGAPSVRELGVLVEDAWQRRGVGRRLAAASARRAGAHRVRLELCRERADLLDYVVTHLPVAARSSEGCDVTVDVPADAFVAAFAEISPPLPRSATETARRPRSSGVPRRGVPVRT